jgi:hypothetical protein
VLEKVAVVFLLGAEVAELGEGQSQLAEVFLELGVRSRLPAIAAEPGQRFDQGLGEGEADNAGLGETAEQRDGEPEPHGQVFVFAVGAGLEALQQFEAGGEDGREQRDRLLGEQVLREFLRDFGQEAGQKLEVAHVQGTRLEEPQGYARAVPEDGEQQHPHALVPVEVEESVQQPDEERGLELEEALVLAGPDRQQEGTPGGHELVQVLFRPTALEVEEHRGVHELQPLD